jgi:hypothetical protein
MAAFWRILLLPEFQKGGSQQPFGAVIENKRLYLRAGSSLMNSHRPRGRQIAETRMRGAINTGSANSCVLQLRAFCFPRSFRPYTIGFPPIKQPLALEAAALAFGWPRKMGPKKETFERAGGTDCCEDE